MRFAQVVAHQQFDFAAKDCAAEIIDRHLHSCNGMGTAVVGGRAGQVDSQDRYAAAAPWPVRCPAKSLAMTAQPRATAPRVHVVRQINSFSPVPPITVMECETKSGCYHGNACDEPHGLIPYVIPARLINFRPRHGAG